MRILILFLFTNLAVAGSCNYQVANRGKIPPQFLNEIITWAKNAPDEIFSANNNYDVYNLMYSKLGPYKNLKHRKASLINFIAVSGGMESSWRWNEGRDESANNTSYCTQETGAFQTSGNILKNFGKDLVPLFEKHCRKYFRGHPSSNDCRKFIPCSKEDHVYAIETHARLLRHHRGYLHYGPILRGEVTKYLSRACVSEIEGKL